MLQIHARQRAAFEGAALADFEARMVEHLRRFSPRHLRIVGDDELYALVVSGQKRAELHGLESERGARIFIEMMVMFGFGFDADPQHPWAREALHGEDDEWLRADRLHAAAWAHVDRTAADDRGADDEPASARPVWQLLQFAGEPAHPAVDPTLQELAIRMSTRVRVAFPRKYEDIGEPAVRRCVEHALATARTFGLASERGLALFTGLSVMFGAEFYHDPQFMWAKRTFSDPGPSPEAARIERLLRGAVGCIAGFWA